MTHRGCTGRFAEFSAGLQWQSIPQDTRKELTRIFVDCLGCAVAAVPTRIAGIVSGLVRDEHGPLEATVFGAGRVTVAQAAFANAVMMNALDLEVYGAEGHLATIGVPVALTVAEALQASGTEMLTALAAGLEVGGRIGAATRRQGWGKSADRPANLGHAHGVFTAVAAAGRLLRLSPLEMEHAFGIAGYSAQVPTLMKFFMSPHAPMTKYDHVGLVAQSGIQAALLAQRGFTGDRDVLEGSIPFWQVSGSLGCDWDAMMRDLGQYWIMNEVWYKPYPVGLSGVTILDLVRRMMSEQGLTPADIDAIEVRIPQHGDRAEKTAVTSPHEAWMSRSCNLACAILDIRPRASWQEPAVYERADVLAMMQKLQFRSLRADETAATGEFWRGVFSVRVSVRASGRTYEGSNDQLRVPDDAELDAKFRENLGIVFSADQVGGLATQAWDIANLRSVGEFAARLARPRA